MNQQLVRTAIFVGGAAVCLWVAIGMAIATRPVKLDDATLVGQEFFPDFKDSTEATGLQVAAYDKGAGGPKVFKVELKDGLWRIPSHHYYPADGEDQLASTAASVVGIKRGVYAGKSAEDQKRMAVLDPLDEKLTETEGRGSRIQLFKDGKTIVDLIVGNKTEETGNIYYVRKADENRVYRTELTGLKVSTKFADWIEPDLLQIDRNKIVMLALDRYHVDEQSRRVVQGEVSLLTKESGNPGAQWELQGLDAEKEKVKVATVSGMTAALDDLKIIGVRPKPAGLAAVLAGQEGAQLSQIDELLMRQAGYFISPGAGELVSNEGEVLAGTDDGIRYTLRFGEVLSGSDLEIEVGNESPSADESPDAKQGEDAEKPDAGDSTLEKNRYVFITALFDEPLLGERPAAPVKPVPPAAQPAAAPTEEPAAPSTEQPAQDATPPADAPSDTEADDEQDPLDAAAEEAEGEAAATEPAAPEAAATEPAAADQSSAQPVAESPPAVDASTPPAGDAAEPAAEVPAAPDPQQVFEAAQKQYEADLAEYERKTEEFDKKVADGQKRAQELSERFAPWYYVISADLFTRLKVDRSALVEPATPPAAAPGAGSAAPLGLPEGFNFPGQPASPPETPEESPADTGAGDTPVEEAAKPSDPPPANDPPATTDSPD